jgi:hypothetical protein
MIHVSLSIPIPIPLSGLSLSLSHLSIYPSLSVSLLGRNPRKTPLCPSVNVIVFSVKAAQYQHQCLV